MSPWGKVNTGLSLKKTQTRPKQKGVSVCDCKGLSRVAYGAEIFGSGAGEHRKANTWGDVSIRACLTAGVELSDESSAWKLYRFSPY